MYQLVVLICLIRVVTPIDVGGYVLLENTTWTREDNPYNVIGDILVPKNVTLTIKSGVEIIFGETGDFQMFVKGFLHVRGTEKKPVIFNGSQAINDTKWMLTMKATNLSHSSVVHAQFYGPKRGVQLLDLAGHAPINTGEVVFKFCLFSDTEIGTMAVASNQWTFVDIPVLTIKNSSIINSVITNNFNAPQLLKLIGTSFENISVNALGGYHGVKMLECSGEDVSIALGYTSERFIEINDTQLRNVAIRLTNPTYGFQTQVIIKGSTLLNASIVMVVYDLEPLQNYVHIISSKLTVSQALELELGSIEDSTISSFRRKSNLTGIIARSISMRRSCIYNFQTGVRILPYGIPMGNISNNNFLNNRLYNIENLGESDVNVTGNWWGTKTNIQDKLFDYWDNINYGEIILENNAQEFIR